MQIRVEGSAQRELFDAITWYETQRQGLGAELLDEVDATLDLLSRHPSIGDAVPHVVSDPAIRRLLLRRFPFQLVYRMRGDSLEIIAVAHLSRAPGYWEKQD